MLIDRVMYKNDILKKSFLATTFISMTYMITKYLHKNEDTNKVGEDENDLRIKKVGRCDKELIEFGNCFKKYNNNSDKCTHLLEAYKKCLQQ